MKLSISNIAWPAEADSKMFEFLNKKVFQGLEIAPTRIFPQDPYDKTQEAADFAMELREKYSLVISSMQSIWFGRSESIFGTAEERKGLADYTRKAVDFAAAMNCNNLVFGCPKNRNIGSASQYPIAVDFFREIGEYAADQGTVIAIEPNPPIYNTNFINTTGQAFELVKAVDCPGLKVNIDLGTILENGESLDLVADHISSINHIHVSEPFLVQIEKRLLHRQLAELLLRVNYSGFVSIEMKNPGSLEPVYQAVEYISEVFHAL